MAAVLAKVQKEVGPAAKISSAQRVRTGGVMGFFQREKFEVLVEIPDPGETSPAPTPQAGPAPQVSAPTATSLLDLAEQVNSAESEPAAQPSPAPAASPPPPVPLVQHVREEPMISTESDSFAEVLSRIAFQSHLTSERNETRHAEPADEIDEIDEIDEVDEVETIGLDDSPEVDETPVDETPEAETPVDERDTIVVEDRPAFLDAQPTVSTAAPAAVHYDSLVPAERTRITDSPLAALGLPVPYIPDAPVAGTDTKALQKVLAQSLEHLPKAPVVRASKGSVIAVVGDRDDAMDLAEDLAHKYGRSKEEIVLASQHYRGKGSAKVLRTIRAAEDSRRSWSRRARPTIVAIETPLGSKSGTWAEQLLAALEPIATYGVADATRKAEDIAAWADTLGGIDCLAINRVDATVSPASVLATGIPVERIDGRKATPAYWAMLLAERLTAA